MAVGANPVRDSASSRKWPDWVGGQQAEESIKTSLTYLGWAIHMLQDATTYYHAQNEVSKTGHAAFEDYVDSQIGYGFFDKLPVMESSSSSAESCAKGKIMLIPDTKPISEIVRFAVARNTREMVFWSGAICGLDDAIELTAAVLNKFFLAIQYNREGLEWDVNRIGQDYRWFDMSTPDAVACRDACIAEGRCRSFTYAPPGFVSAQARCHLKSGIPQPSFTNTYGLASGVVREEEGLERNVDRMGSDLRWFDTQEPAESCRDACVDDDRCRAFTLTPPGHFGPKARCYLKSQAPRPTFALGMVSGVVTPVQNGPWIGDTGYVGGNGGTEKDFRCPENMLAAGVLGATYGNGYVSNLGLVCVPRGDYTPGKEYDRALVFAGGSRDVGFYVTPQSGMGFNAYLDKVLAQGEGTLKPGRQSVALCPQGEFMTAIEIRTERALSSIFQLRCQKPERSGTTAVKVEDVPYREIGTYEKGDVRALVCAESDAFVSGMRIRSGYFTDGVSFHCRRAR